MKNNQLKNNFTLKWEHKELGELLDYEQPAKYVVASENYNDNYKTPVLTAGKTFVLGYTDENFGIYKKLPVIIFDDFVAVHKFVDFPFKVKSSAIKILIAKNNVNLKFVYGWMQIHPYSAGEHKRNYLSEYQYQDVLIPSFFEQNRIVAVLEAWDRVIEKIENKIKIKKQIKKWLMCNLVFGSKRLSGFDDRRKIIRLGDVCKMSSGGTPKSTKSEYYGGKIPWVSIADMTGNGKYIYRTFKNLTKLGLQNSAAKIYPKGTILYAMYASIGECSIAGTEMTSSQAILGIDPDKKYLDPVFLYFYLTIEKERIRLQGQQGAQSNLNAGIVKNFVFKLPTLKEQLAIVNILNTADREISELERKLSLIKDQKKHLLNNLITGKIRVPETLKIN